LDTIEIPATVEREVGDVRRATTAVDGCRVRLRGTAWRQAREVFAGADLVQAKASACGGERGASDVHPAAGVHEIDRRDDGHTPWTSNAAAYPGAGVLAESE